MEADTPVMREIIFDTETTGIDPRQGHRMVEIGCVELVDRMPTGETFHAYYNPDRDMPAEAEAIHGLSAQFLADKPRFADAVDEFLDFVRDDKLVAHNAGFDFAFLNAELELCAREPICLTRKIDTLEMARRKNPRSMRCAHATGSIAATVFSMARCWMRSFWRKSISN